MPETTTRGPSCLNCGSHIPAYKDPDTQTYTDFCWGCMNLTPCTELTCQAHQTEHMLGDAICTYCLIGPDEIASQAELWQDYIATLAPDEDPGPQRPQRPSAIDQS